jgi:hypothetical protein
VSAVTADPVAVLGACRRALQRLPDVLDALLGGLEGEAWRARPAPSEWSAVEIVCHFRDEEAEDFGARVRVVLTTAEDVPRPDRWPVGAPWRGRGAAQAVTGSSTPRAARRGRTRSVSRPILARFDTIEACMSRLKYFRNTA